MLKSIEHNLSPEYNFALDRIILLAFDAFADIQRTEGRACVLPLQRAITLPKLGLVLDKGTSEVMWSPNQIEVRGPSDIRKVIPTSMRWDVYAGANLLNAAEEFLFESAYLDTFAEDRQYCSQTATHVSEARKLIETVDPVFARLMFALQRWIVAIRAGDPGTHSAFTSPELRGVAFVSDTPNVLWLAQALIHEHHHDILNMVMAIRPLFDSADVRVFYSPWRNDPRPLSGLIHAIFVFSAVAEFQRRVLEQDKFSDQRMWLKARHWATICRLHIAIAQVPRESLTELGRALLNEIDRRCGTRPELNRMASCVRMHVDEWRANNPQIKVADLSA
jgi:HEXXH motif-containing protein